MTKINVPLKVEIKSNRELRLIVRNPDGSIDQDSGWFPNLVLDGGLVNMTTVSAWANRFHIGDSNNAPSVTDTALFGWLAQSNTGAADVAVNLGALNYQAQETRTRRFNPGAARTIREVGVNNNVSNTEMSIRALVTPEITQSPVQILDVLYRLTTWPSLVDGTGITNIFGDDYDYTVRMGEVDLFTGAFDEYVPRSAATTHQAYNGDIGSITGSPAGDVGFASDVEITNQTSGVCDYTITFGVDNGNLSGGIRSIRSQILGSVATAIYIQVEFRNRGEGTGALDSAIPKNDTREITFDLGLTWGRH